MRVRSREHWSSCLVSPADRTSGWTRLGVVSNRLVQAQFGPDAALNDPLYRLSRSFYIL